MTQRAVVYCPVCDRSFVYPIVGWYAEHLLHGHAAGIAGQIDADEMTEANMIDVVNRLNRRKVERRKAELKVGAKK